MQDFATVIKTYAYYHTAAVVGIGVLLNLLIMAYQMHLCERELWLPRDAHTGLAPARFDDIDGARLLPLPPHHGEPVLFDAQGNAYYQSPYVSLLNAFYFIGIVSTTTGQCTLIRAAGCVDDVCVDFTLMSLPLIVSDA